MEEHNERSRGRASEASVGGVSGTKGKIKNESQRRGAIKSVYSKQKMGEKVQQEGGVKGQCKARGVENKEKREGRATL